MERRDWVLAALDAADGEPLTPIQLQKSLFLLSKERPEVARRRFFKFTPYSYGPFDSSMYLDGQSLADEGFITISRPDFGAREYRTTAAGSKAARGLDLKPDVRRHLRKIVTYVTSLTFRELVSEIYKRYPSTRTRSVFR